MTSLINADILSNVKDIPGSGLIALFILIDKPDIKPKLKNIKLEASVGDDYIAHCKLNDFKAENGTTMCISYPNGKFKKICFVGTKQDKDGKKINNDILFQKLGAKIADMSSSISQEANVVISATDDVKKQFDDAISETYFGFGQKIYRFSKYLTQEKAIKKLPKVKKIFLDAESGESKKIELVNQKLESIYLVRDLVNEPANVLYPDTFAKIAKDELKNYKNVSIDVLGQKELKELGANALLGVAQGSDKEAKMVVMQYKGKPKSNDFDIAFIGKGVTFDTGGISIKPSDGMEDMKGDMAGAATVLGTLKLLAARKANVNAIAVMGLVENMPSGTAQRPGDIVKSMSGQTIEVLNTDAEGRLVLADVLYYTQTKFKPKYMIDLATLTGAIVVALGSHKAGLYSNSDEMAENLMLAGDATGDYCWRMPLGEEYNKMMDSKIADMKNISGTREGGSITAAAFLERFIAGNKNWAHIDIAGTSDNHKDLDLSVAGGTGFGIKLLDKFVLNIED